MLLQAGAQGVFAASAALLGQSLAQRQFGVAPAFVDSLFGDFSPLQYCLVGVLAAALKTVAGAGAVYAQKSAAGRAADEARGTIAGAILGSGVAMRAAAETHAALVIRLREVERGVDDGVLGCIRAVANLAPLGVMLVILSSPLALVSFAALAPFAVLLALGRRRLRASSTRAAALAEELHVGMDELVRHLDLWRTYGAATRVRRVLAQAGLAAGKAAARAETARAALSGSNEVLAALALLAVVAIVERGGIPLGRGPLVAFATVFFLLYRPLRDLGDARAALERGAVAWMALDGIRAELGRATDHAVHTDLCTKRTRTWELATLDVSDLEVTRGTGRVGPASLLAPAGSFVAVVGPTGVGKTTLLRALLGLEREVVGAIRYGSESLLEAGVGPEARPFAWVPQEPAIVAGTVGENVALGAPDGAADRVAQDALAAIGAEALLARAGGVVSAGGPELSGGERQWVAIARAVATGLPVLLLDEPTSGLDDESQHRVLSALAALRGKRTIILVTHRPEPAAIADAVVRLEGSTF